MNRGKSYGLKRIFKNLKRTLYKFNSYKIILEGNLLKKVELFLYEYRDHSFRGVFHVTL